jgi:predicted CoA-substrate-specific enzyme activase
MNMSSQREDTNRVQSAFPSIEHECEVSYRVPFSYLKTDDEMRQDAWNAILPLFRRLPSVTSTPQVSENMEIVRADLQIPVEILRQRGLLIQAIFSRSDLWVKISPLSSSSSEVHELVLSQLDKCFQHLGRPVFKYVVRKGRLKAFPNKNHQWGEHVHGFIGVDAGSISINTAIIDESGVVLETDYTLTEGDVLNNIKKSLSRIQKHLPENLQIHGAGVTGSGQEIAMAVLNADVYETELDAHAEAAINLVPGVQVIFDIGGQDSKVMYIEDGMLDEAGMNKKCGAGTGAFLDAQAARLGIPIEEFGPLSLQAKKPYEFSSMCTVFVGRDLISEQAKGNTKDNIIAGLHKSLAKNFFSTLGIDKKHLKTPIAFQGGVATNIGVKRALEECLEEARGQRCEVIIPLYNNVMGAIGMALIARRQAGAHGKTRFRGFEQASRILSVFTECDRHEHVGCGKNKVCDLVNFFIDSVPDQTLYACKEYYLEGSNQASEVRG